MTVFALFVIKALWNTHTQRLNTKPAGFLRCVGETEIKNGAGERDLSDFHPDLTAREAKQSIDWRVWSL